MLGQSRLNSFIAAGLFTAVSALALPRLTLRNTASEAGNGQVITLGHPFKLGDIPAGKVPTISSVSGGKVTLQVDVKSRHTDGSVKHAVLSMRVDGVAAKGSVQMDLGPGDPTPGTPLALADVAAALPPTTLTLKIGSEDYVADFKAAFLAAGAKPWLTGPVCGEWLMSVPFKSGAGALHPHLYARFGLRAYAGLKQFRLDVTVENNWAYEPGPQGFTYDAILVSGGQTLYSKAAIPHTSHARWRKTFWIGGAPTLDWEHDVEYWLSTGFFPYYDRTVKLAPEAFNNMPATFDPMSNGNLSDYMPQTGAQEDIGPLPRFAALFMLTGDPRAKANVIANGEAGGAYQIHYRDKVKNLIVSLDDYPYMTLLGNTGDTRNPKTNKLEEFPAVTNGLSKHTPDDAHQPSIAYLPFILTGDHFFLEELQFWANYNMLMANPYYRDFASGLLKWGQVRAQAWSLRTLGHAAFITPDDDPLKAYFNDKLKLNLAYYNKTFSNNPDANKLGLLWNEIRRPWMDDFFTWSVGFLVELGYKDAEPLLQFKGKFPVGRLTPPYCWLKASIYEDTRADSSGKPLPDFAAFAKANNADGPCTGTVMEGAPAEPDGYGANMQPAIAVAVDGKVPGAAAAWAVYQGRNPKQDYSKSPQFAVVPKASSLVALQGARSLRSQAGAPRLAARRYIPGETVLIRLTTSAKVLSEFFDSTGRLIASRDLGILNRGEQRIMISATDLPQAGRALWVRFKTLDAFQAESLIEHVQVMP